LKRRDAGYAMIVAVAGMMAFAYISFDTIAANRGAIASVGGQVKRARLEAAANAGIMVAIHGLGITEDSKRWTIDNTPRTIALGNMILTISIEDERGKIPINRLDEDQVRSLFASAGITGKQLDTLVDSFEDWQDPSDDARANGAKAAYYLQFGIQPRNGPFRTVDELTEIRGMSDDLFNKLQPVLTVFFGDAGGFSVATAQPLATSVMTDTGGNGPPPPPPPLGLITVADLVGRPLTVNVDVKDTEGDEFQRKAIVELTGAKTNTYWIRYLN
jgi:general secretion pathway protein K